VKVACDTKKRGGKRAWIRKKGEKDGEVQGDLMRCAPVARCKRKGAGHGKKEREHIPRIGGGPCESEEFGSDHAADAKNTSGSIADRQSRRRV